MAGLQLFVLTGQTDRFFAWTIAVALSAAFLGAGYWAAVPMTLAAWREPVWANARIAVPGVWVFTTLTLVVTIRHRDTMAQERVALAQVKGYLAERLVGA